MQVFELNLTSVDPQTLSIDFQIDVSTQRWIPQFTSLIAFQSEYDETLAKIKKTGLDSTILHFHHDLYGLYPFTFYTVNVQIITPEVR